MKVLLLTLSTLLITQCEWLIWDEPDPNDIVLIPDNVFLSILVEQGVDTDGDGMISYGEARLIDSLDVGNSSFEGTYLHIGDNIWCSYEGAINSLKGIEAFKNLRFLDCSESNLTSLNVTHNPKLIHLDCSDQKIPELDVSHCPDLKSLNCHNNLIKELNLSDNTQLIYLWTQQNQLANLDIFNNSKLTEISIDDMPELYEVCVWVLPFPPSEVHVSKNDSPNIYFTTECSQ